MITETTAKKIAELSANEEFMGRMQQAQTVEELHRVLTENGVEISVKDVEAACAAGKEKYDSECSVDELDSVAGGCIIYEGIKTGANLIYGLFAVGFNMATKGKYHQYIPPCRW